jgi:adenylate cyclase
MTVEIERKFLVERIPDGIASATGEQMRQGYVAQDADVSVRVRMTARARTLTVKAGTGMTRTEIELSLTDVQADALWPHTAGRRIDKTRYRVALDDGTVAELDVYSAELAGLYTVEVEFESEFDAASFVAPAWFGADVTDDVRWSNASLALHGRPC